MEEVEYVLSLLYVLTLFQVLHYNPHNSGVALLVDCGKLKMSCQFSVFLFSSFFKKEIYCKQSQQLRGTLKSIHRCVLCSFSIASKYLRGKLYLLHSSSIIFCIIILSNKYQLGVFSFCYEQLYITQLKKQANEVAFESFRSSIKRLHTQFNKNDIANSNFPPGTPLQTFNL